MRYKQYSNSRRLRKRWDSNIVLTARKKLCLSFNKNSEESNIVYEAIDFFDSIGLFIFKDMLDIDLVDNEYGHYIELYWHVSRPYIEKMKANEGKTMYDKFEYLDNRILSHRDHIKFDANDYIEDEIKEIDEKLELLEKPNRDFSQ